MARKNGAGGTIDQKAAFRDAVKAAAVPPRPVLPLFYKDLKPVDATQHRGKSLRRVSDFSFARGAHAVLLNVSEFEVAARYFPIVFTPPPGPAALAVVGLRREENLFVDSEGNWRAGTYIPAYIRRYPFIFHESPDRQQFTLCIDETAGALEEGESRPLFVDNKPAEAIENALQFCATFQRDHQMTVEFVNALGERGLLTPNHAEITLSAGEKLSVSGFHVIDRAKFQALPDAIILDWRRRGWLALCYAHFISQASWGALVDLAGREKAAAKS